MTLAQAQYLRIYDAAGVTYQRWQAYWVGRTVSYLSQVWTFQEFEASGVTLGQTGDESGLRITLPATPLVVDAVEPAIAEGRLAELRITQFRIEAAADDANPPASQDLLALFTGEIVSASATLTSMVLELGSALAPVGAQIPPRTFVTQLIGQGCRL